MASVRKRKLKTVTKWIVDYRDHKGRRRYVTCETKADAERVRAEKVREPGGNPRTTLGELWEMFYRRCEVTVTTRTLRIYTTLWRNHLESPLAARPVVKLVRSELEMVFAGMLRKGYKPKTIQTVAAILHGIMKVAVRDGMLTSNPANRITEDLGLSRLQRGDSPAKAFSRVELALFLDKTKELYPFLYPMFLTMARTGLRINEAIGLQWECVDLEGEHRDGELVFRIHVRQSCINEPHRPLYLDKTKSRLSRHVDIGKGLREMLRQHRRESQEAMLAKGRHLGGDDVVFPHPNGGMLNSRTIPRQFKRICKEAGLPAHFHPHCLRHTFASQHLIIGTPITYLKEQLGHSKIDLTINTYGHWLSKTNMAAADRLDDYVKKISETT